MPVPRSWPFILLLAGLALSHVQPAHAQTPPELSAARALFSEALKDEEQRRFDVALEKFRRVLAVRDTVNVRYRMGVCLEALGQWRNAREMFASIESAPASADTDVATVRSAASRSLALGAKMPRVVLRLSSRAPADTEVRVDGRSVPRDKLSQPVLLDPGEHVVEAQAQGVPTFRTSISLSSGGAAELTLPMDPPAGVTETRAPSKPHTASSSTLPIIALASGGVLLTASVITLVLRHSDIAKLERSCPQGACPSADRDDLSATRSRALVEGPLGVGLGVLGVVALGIGGYGLATSGTGSATAQPSIVVGVRGNRVTLGGEF